MVVITFRALAVVTPRSAPVWEFSAMQFAIPAPYEFSDSVL